MASQWGGFIDGHEVDEPTWFLYGYIHCRHCGRSIYGTTSQRECIPNGWKMEDQEWWHEEFSPIYLKDRAKEIRGAYVNA